VWLCFCGGCGGGGGGGEGERGEGGGGSANISKNKKLGWCTNIGIVVIAINTVHLTLRPIIFHFFLFAPISFAIYVVERYKVLNRQRAQGTCKRTLFYSREIT